MASRKKHMDPAVIEHAHAVVAENPRGAPETIKEPQSAPVELPCALDGEQFPAKLIVVGLETGGKQPVMTVRGGSKLVSAGDLSWRLPIGAKIRLLPNGGFHSVQLDPTVSYPPLITATAREAIMQFIPHFHR